MKNLMPLQWQELLKEEFEKPYFTELERKVASAYASSVVYPSRGNLFRALELCKPEEVKVVILGQDPYHEPGQAHGLAFSVPPMCQAPSSLNHIFQEISMEFQTEPLPDNTLERWARQGVLLLNSILTVQAGHAASHSAMGWQEFTDAVIARISEKCDGVVFMLWGKSAIAKRSLIDETKHKIYTSTHPSGLSWGKTSNIDKMKGCAFGVDKSGDLQASDILFVYKGFGRLRNDSFWGSMQFRATNNYLMSKGKNPIDWR